MTKKRQQDFTKVHLKPGRSLRRSNVTLNTYKSKKIVMPKERIVKMKSGDTIEACTRRIKKASSEKDKSNHLSELNKLIRQSDSLNTELKEIFEVVLDLMRNPHDTIRNTALKILLYVLENTEDSNLRCYTEPINRNIFAIMKNPIPKIASASLILIDCLVKNHPDLICHNMEILLELLPTEKVHFTRQPTFEKGTFLYSETDEINNIGHINTFLKGMLENTDDVAENEDDEDKDVYLDEDQIMFLVLYTSGGLKPIDIEKIYSKQFNPQVDILNKAVCLTDVIDVLIRIIPGIFSRIIRCQSSADDNTLRSESIADLSIIVQVLCHMTEIAERISNTVAAEEIATIIKEKVYSPYRKRFPFELLTVLPGASLEPLAMLNTSLCFLFMKFLFSNDSSDGDWQLIQRYLRKFFTVEKGYSSEIKYKCIPLFIKMIQLFKYKSSAPDVIFLLLKQLIFLLKTRINHPYKKKLINFLYEMSVNPEYEFWFESEPMMLWFNWLASHMKENTNKINRNLLKIICKISKLRHPSFMRCVDFNVIKPLFKNRSDDFKEAAIILLHNMDIDNKTFKNVYTIISQDYFPRKFAVTLIHMLNARFNQYSMNEKVIADYIQFLLNTAVGVYNASRSRLVDLDDNKCAKTVKVVKPVQTFTIVPSLYWKEHSQLFQLCQTYLKNLPEDAVNLTFARLVREMLNGRLVLPIHCALAILKLYKDLPEFPEIHYNLLMRDLNFSCIMTISVLTHTPVEDEWYKWNVQELLNSVFLTERSTSDILNLLSHYNFGKANRLGGYAIYFILRVLKVFVEKRLLNYEHRDEAQLMADVLKRLTEICCDEDIKKQPLYSQLYEFLEQYLK